MAIFTQRQKALLFEEIDRIPQFRGVGVAFVGQGQCGLLRQQVMPVGLRRWIVLQEVEGETPIAWSYPATPPRSRDSGWSWPTWGSVAGRRSSPVLRLREVRGRPQ
jgi:hypothetical protein